MARRGRHQHRCRWPVRGTGEFRTYHVCSLVVSTASCGCWLLLCLIAVYRSGACWQRVRCEARLVVLDTVLDAGQSGGQVVLVRPAWPPFGCMWLRLPQPTHITIPASSCMCVPGYVVYCTCVARAHGPTSDPSGSDPSGSSPRPSIQSTLDRHQRRPGKLHFQAQSCRRTNSSLVSKLTALSLTFRQRRII